MRKLVLTSVVSVALFAAVSVGTASASTVGDIVCGVDAVVCSDTTGISDWDGFEGTHCNNLAAGPGDDTGTRSGNAEYHLGSPTDPYDSCNGPEVFTGVGYVNVDGVGGYPDPATFPHRNPGSGSCGYIEAQGVSAGGCME